nr:MAG TPA: deoxyguanosine kinase [Caudoviricetes sp.]
MPRPLIPYALTPAPPGPMGAGVSTSARIAVKAEAPRLRSGPH